MKRKRIKAKATFVGLTIRDIIDILAMRGDELPDKMKLMLE